MPNGSISIYVQQPGVITRLLRVLWLTCVRAYQDNCFGTAKGAAYSALLSVFPVLTTVTALLVQANAPAVARVISHLVFDAAPPGTQELLQNYLEVQGKRPVGLLVLASLVSVWAASGTMMSLMEGFQAAYRLPSGRPFLKQRGMAALLVLCAALPLVAGSAIILFGSRTEGMIAGWLGFTRETQDLQGWVVVIGRLFRFILAFGSIVVSAGILYKLGPNCRIRMRTVWPGSLLATLVWGAATLIFGWYVRNVANYNVLYGSIGAVIALLVWMYILAVVALFGCEFNVAWADNLTVAED